MLKMFTFLGKGEVREEEISIAEMTSRLSVIEPTRDARLEEITRGLEDFRRSFVAASPSCAEATASIREFFGAMG